MNKLYRKESRKY